MLYLFLSKSDINQMEEKEQVWRCSRTEN